MSLQDPGIPKHGWHIQSELLAIASRVKFGRPSIAWYWSCQATELFFHFHWQQSKLPNKPGIPVSHYCFKIRTISTSVGLLKYFLPTKWLAATQKCSKNFIVVASEMESVSSSASAQIPYTIIPNEAVILVFAERPRRPVQSFFWNKDWLRQPYWQFYHKLSF